MTNTYTTSKDDSGCNLVFNTDAIAAKGLAYRFLKRRCFAMVFLPENELRFSFELPQEDEIAEFLTENGFSAEI